MRLPSVRAGSGPREVNGSPPGPATATIQVPPSTPREGWEEVPGTSGLDIEEEEQPPGEAAQEQGEEETSGSSSEVLERLRRNIEKKKDQEERRNISHGKKVRDGERSFSEGAGELDRQTYAELLEREGFVLGLEVTV